jgi:hypothetical protein
MSELPRTQLPDGPPLPEMREAVLSSDDVQAFVADLHVHATIQSTICKYAARHHAPPAAIPIEEAVARLLDRSVTAIQVRYQFDGHEWTDTLLNAPAGIRLVRCQHTPAE